MSSRKKTKRLVTEYNNPEVFRLTAPTNLPSSIHLREGKDMFPYFIGFAIALIVGGYILSSITFESAVIFMLVVLTLSVIYVKDAINDLIKVTKSK